MNTSDRYSYGDGGGSGHGTGINTLKLRSYNTNIDLANFMYISKVCLDRGIFNNNDRDQPTSPCMPLLKSIVLELKMEKAHG